MKDALSLIRDLNGKFEAENMRWKHLICDQINTSGASAVHPLSGKIAVIMKEYLSGLYNMSQELEPVIAELCRSNSMLSDENTKLSKKLISLQSEAHECYLKNCELESSSIPISDISYVGEYHPATCYKPGDVVKYSESLYLCCKRISGVLPKIKNIHWKRISQNRLKTLVNADIIDKLNYAGLYDPTVVYTEGAIVKYDNHLWVSLMDDNKIEPTKIGKNGCCTWYGISQSDKLVVSHNEFERVIKDKINASQTIKYLKDENMELTIKYNDIQHKLSHHGSKYNEAQELSNSLTQIINLCHINIEDIHQTDEDALEPLDDIESREKDIIKLARKIIEKIIGESIDA